VAGVGYAIRDGKSTVDARPLLGELISLAIGEARRHRYEYRSLAPLGSSLELLSISNPSTKLRRLTGAALQNCFGRTTLLDRS